MIEGYWWVFSIIFILGILAFISLIFYPAPYGRHYRSLGITIPSRLGWILMESPATFSFALCFLFARHTLTAPLWIFFIMWQIHYVYRSFVFPFKKKNGNPMAILIVCLGAVFTFTNGFLNGAWLSMIGPTYSSDWFFDIRFIIGTALFFLGFGINYFSDNQLLNLKNKHLDYQIPTGGLFNWVSCPNYLGEIIEWVGWTIATWSPAGLLFVFWTIANLGPRAVAHHQWYHATFKNYPKERYALFPFIL